MLKYSRTKKQSPSSRSWCKEKVTGAQWQLKLLKRVPLVKKWSFFCNHRVNQGERRQKFSLFPSALESPTLVSQWLNLTRSQNVIGCNWWNHCGYRAGPILDRLGLVYCQFCNKVSQVWHFFMAPPPGTPLFPKTLGMHYTHHNHISVCLSFLRSINLSGLLLSD